MFLKKISAAAAGLALLASGPAIAANSAPNMLVSAAAIAQDDNDNDEDGDEDVFERYLPFIVVIAFTAVFVYFLLDSQENDTTRPRAPITPVSP